MWGGRGGSSLLLGSELFRNWTMTLSELMSTKWTDWIPEDTSAGFSQACPVGTAFIFVCKQLSWEMVFLSLVAQPLLLCGGGRGAWD